MLPPCEHSDELFLAETKRTVKKDNTFSFQGHRFEAPLDLRGQKIDVRYDRCDTTIVFVYDALRRLGEARPLDPIHNATLRMNAIDESEASHA